MSEEGLDGTCCDGAFPARVEVASTSYRLVLVRDPEVPLGKGDGHSSGTMGHTDFHTSTITLRVAEVSHDQVRDTLLHEIVHAVNFAGQLRLKERETTVLATLLLDVLRRNPAVTTALLSREPELA